VSSVLLQGQKAKAGRLNRVPAEQVEQLVIDAVHQRIQATTLSGRRDAQPAVNSSDVAPNDRQFIRAQLRRVDINAEQLVVRMTAAQSRRNGLQPVEANPSNGPPASGDIIIRVPWTKRPSKIAREIIPAGDPHSRRDRRPIRAETRARLVSAIAQGRRWLDELVTGDVISVQHIAERERCSARQVNMTISLALLSPSLVQAAVEGRLPRGVGIASLRDAPVSWSLQHKMLGLSL
jgi:site-specific DNA recombinase